MIVRSGVENSEKNYLVITDHSDWSAGTLRSICERRGYSARLTSHNLYLKRKYVAWDTAVSAASCRTIVCRTGKPIHCARHLRAQHREVFRALAEFSGAVMSDATSDAAAPSTEVEGA